MRGSRRGGRSKSLSVSGKLSDVYDCCKQKLHSKLIIMTHNICLLSRHTHRNTCQAHSQNKRADSQTFSIDYIVVEQSVQSSLIDSICYQFTETMAKILLNGYIHILYLLQGLRSPANEICIF